MNLDGRLYLAHRLAWFYVHGVWPSQQIDHINRCRTDNRLVNLREATSSENCQNRPLQRNSTSGHTGVTWNATLLKWHARISLGGKRRHIGWYHTKEEAIKARKAAEASLHPYRTS